jgi:hypothetical protein
MKLIYVPRNGFKGPSAPWPGQDHDEPDEGVAKAKLASQFYRSESGKEIKDRAAAVAKAKVAANAKAAENIKAEATDARAEAESATRAAERLTQNAEAAEAKARATAARRGGR